MILFQKWSAKCIDKVSFEREEKRKINAFRAFLFWDLKERLTKCKITRNTKCQVAFNWNSFVFIICGGQLKY